MYGYIFKHVWVWSSPFQVIKIPLAAIQDKPSSSPALPGATEPSEVESDEDRHHLTINISKEVNSSGSLFDRCQFVLLSDYRNVAMDHQQQDFGVLRSWWKGRRILLEADEFVNSQCRI